MSRFQEGFQSDNNSSSDDDFWSTSPPRTKPMSAAEDPKEKETSPPPPAVSQQPLTTDKKKDNIDDMEDSLFNTFASSQRKKRQQKVSERQQKSQATNEVTSAVAKPSTSESDSKPTAQKKQSQAETKQKKSYFNIDDDLLADLLSESDEEEKIDQKPVKPATTNPEAIDPGANGTAATEDSVFSLSTASRNADNSKEEEIRMPSFLAETKPVLPPVKGKKSDLPSLLGDLPPLTTSANSELPSLKSALPPLKKHGRRTTDSSSPPEIKPDLPSFLDSDLDSPTDQKPKVLTPPRVSKKKTTKSRRSTAKLSPKSSDEDDDILSSLGLDETPVTKKKQPTKKKESKKPVEESTKPLTNPASEPKSTEAAATSRQNNKEPDMSLFGSYLPTTSSSKSKTLPIRGLLNLSSPSLSSTSSPSTSPNSPKKNVRFSETLEISDGVVRTKTSINDLNGKSAVNVLSQKSAESAPSTDASQPSPSLAAEPVLTPPNEPPKVESRHTSDTSTSLFGEIESPVKQPRKRPSFLKSSAAANLFDEPPKEPVALDEAVPSQEQPEAAISSPVVDGDPLLLLFDSSPSPTKKEKKRKKRSSPPLSPTKSSPSNSPTEVTPSISNQLLTTDQPEPVQIEPTNLVLPRPPSLTSSTTQQSPSILPRRRSIERETSDSKLRERGEDKIRELEAQLKLAEEKAKQQKQRMEEEKEQQALELNKQLSELKLQLHKSELEIEKLNLSMEAAKQSHSAELLAAQTSNSDKLQSLEEEFKRKQSRLISEKESEVSLCKQQLQQLEQEKLTVVTTLKKQVSTLEETRDSEMTKIKETHRFAFEELKRQHKFDIEHMKQRHREEIEDLKSAYSHTRMLAELTHQVESSVKEVSSLHGRFSDTVIDSQKEREEVLRAKESQLKCMEKRLVMQQNENDKEREHLHSLLAKFERHISEKSNELERDRWKLQQDMGRLEAREKAFDEDREIRLRKIEQQKEQLQREKERMLADHQEGLAKTYSETRSVASERAELAALDKALREREQEITKKTMRVEADLIAAEAKLSSEKERMAREQDQLAQAQRKLSLEREEVDDKLRRVEATKHEVEKRTQSLDRIAKSADDMQAKGLEAIQEVEKKQYEINKQWKLLKKEAAQLREKEKILAMDRVMFLKEKREHMQQVSAASHVDTQFQQHTTAGGSPTFSNYSVNFDPNPHHHTVPVSSTPHTFTSHHSPSFIPQHYYSMRHSNNSRVSGNDHCLCNACGAHNRKYTVPSQHLSKCLQEMERNAEIDHKVLREEAKFLGYLEATNQHYFRNTSSPMMMRPGSSSTNNMIRH